MKLKKKITNNQFGYMWETQNNRERILLDTINQQNRAADIEPVTIPTEYFSSKNSALNIFSKKRTTTTLKLT